MKCLRDARRYANASAMIAALESRMEGIRGFRGACARGEAGSSAEGRTGWKGGEEEEAGWESATAL